jgi:hypothetical protein
VFSEKLNYTSVPPTMKIGVWQPIPMPIPLLTMKITAQNFQVLVLEHLNIIAMSVSKKERAYRYRKHREHLYSTQK